MFKSFFLRRQQNKARRYAQALLSSTVGSVMSPYVVTVKPTSSVIQAATRMIAQSISCIVVVDTQDARVPLGMVTERDFIKKVPASSKVINLKVSDIMSKKVICLSSKNTLLDAHKIMVKEKVRKLVVQNDGHLVGILTQTDLVAYAEKMLKVFVNEELLATQFMTKKIITAKSNISFPSARQLMMKNDIGALLLKDKTFEGIFTEYDVVLQYHDKGGILQIKSPKEIMHKTICCIESSATIHFATRVMLEKNMRRLLILENEKAIGILTQTDLAHALYNIAQDIARPEFICTCTKFHLPTHHPIESRYTLENFKIYFHK